MQAFFFVDAGQTGFFPFIEEHFIDESVKSQGIPAHAADKAVQESFTIFPIVKRALL